MQTPVILLVAGTRAEVLAGATLLEALRALPVSERVLEPRLLVTRQEDTELEQALDLFGLEPDDDLGIKTPHLADAALAGRLVTEMEAALRHHSPAIVVTLGLSASAWATAVASFYKGVPLVHLGSGQMAPDGERPYPEWLHAEALTRVAKLHLCPDDVCMATLGRHLAPADGAVPAAVVGHGADEALARAVASEIFASDEDDPTLRGLRPGAPRVLVFLRRREHHADALRPMCRALEAASGEWPDHEFVVVHSLQAHICDALVALLPRVANVRGVSPLPHPVFVREVSRARLVVTDSAGVGREAAFLGRPLVMVGRYALTDSLRAFAAERSPRMAVVPMDAGALHHTLGEALSGGAPEPWVAGTQIVCPPAGRKAMDRILEWWQRLHVPPAAPAEA
jgi:UDP-N-acetylglucosamine 2-epimerase (non-hydrolysing)